MDEAPRCRYRYELVHPLAEDGIVRKERKHPGPDRQAHSQRRRMSQSLSFRDSCTAPYQRAIGIAETEEDIPQDRLRYYVGMQARLMDERPWEIGS